LEFIGRLNKCDGDSVRVVLKQIYVEKNGETLKNINDRDLFILTAMFQPDSG